MLRKIKESTEFLQKKTNRNPQVGIILGTGLGGLVNEIEIEYSISYEEIPNFPFSTVEGHSGRLIFGNLGGKQVVAMQGRFHFYEGYTMDKVTFPVRVMKLLGIKNLIVSNASGGVNPNYQVGDLMILSDHINLIPNPLIGKNITELGPRFPDMSDAYCSTLIAKAEAIAKANNIPIKKGVYIALTGPTLETPAEYKHMRIIGGDTVGMSTAPEVIVARHMDIPCFAMSVITDLGVPGKIKKVTHAEIQQVSEVAEPKLTLIIKKLITNI
ncbi:MAG: purine-nucleoside phosphorylase [Flavobacteriales bacterium]|jgi:purine-nucleoside phosphorylase|nr:purine-nucleoside phosphorylase [Flavobacteriales bacterium]MBT5090430.1 purine-nucleoside phosphorylase [Flavobacteriales bacterium]MBT5750908.1 purine-nucleoside phosphorylase [Flavobacteriales bacterium]